MRKILLPAFCFLATTVFSQTNNITVNMNGISDFKIGMKKQEIEKLIAKTITLKNLNKEDWMMDTFKCQYKGAEFTLIFDRDYIDDNNFNIILYEVNSNSTLLKTPGGISIGDDKIKIVTTYDGYTIYLMPEWENDYTVKSKTRSLVMVHGDESGHVITFHMNNNKVESMSVSVEEGD